MQKNIRNQQQEFSLKRLSLGGWIEPYAEPEDAFQPPPELRLVQICEPWPERDRARSARRASRAQRASASAAQSDGGDQTQRWMRVRGFAGLGHEVFPDAPLEPFPRAVGECYPEMVPMTPPSTARTPASPAPSSADARRTPAPAPAPTPAPTSTDK